MLQHDYVSIAADPGPVYCKQNHVLLLQLEDLINAADIDTAIFQQLKSDIALMEEF